MRIIDDEISVTEIDSLVDFMGPASYLSNCRFRQSPKKGVFFGPTKNSVFDALESDV